MQLLIFVWLRFRELASAAVERRVNKTACEGSDLSLLQLKVMLDAVLFEISIINCQDCVFVVAAELPHTVIKHSMGVGLLTSHERMDGKIEMAHSAAVVLRSLSCSRAQSLNFSLTCVRVWG